MSSSTVSGATATYTYAGDDVRATRTVAGSTTTYLWDRQARLPELVDDGTTVTLQTRDGVQTEIAKGTGAATSDLLDGQGSVRAQTDGSGAATGSAACDPWGNPRGPVTTATGMGWTGESRDATTGLTYLRARDYDPLRGRFTARDTVSPNGPGSQGYNAYAYAAGNPVSRLDPTGHQSSGGGPSADPIGNLVGGIEALIGATLKLAALIPWALGLPFGLGPVIAALLGWAITMLRTTIVMLMLSIGGLLVGSLTGFTGTALYLLAFLHRFRPMRQHWARCTADWRKCSLLAAGFPRVPTLREMCAYGLCDLLRRLRDSVGVIGVCDTLSFARYLEGAFTYCEVRDRSGQYGWAITGAVMGALGPGGGSDSLGVLLGHRMSSIYDLGGFGVTGDFTLVKGGGVDVNVAFNPMNYSGIATTVSPAGGSEIAGSVGVTWTWVGDQPILGFWAWQRILDFAAGCLWGSQPADCVPSD